MQYDMFLIKKPTICTSKVYITLQFPFLHVSASTIVLHYTPYVQDLDMNILNMPIITVI